VVGCRLSLEGVSAPVVALEINLGLQDEGRRQPVWEADRSQLVIRDPHMKVSVTLALEPAGAVVTFPIDTVSDSEEGLERTMQGVAVVCLWPVASAEWSASVQATVESLG
jgi:hypothetical protein